VLGVLGAKTILFPEPTEPKFARPEKTLNYSRTEFARVLSPSLLRVLSTTTVGYPILLTAETRSEQSS